MDKIDESNSISVFTPTYNRSNTLRRLYKSLLNQTFKNFEWLIVDDGSTDDTEIVTRKFVEDGLIRIRYIRQENGGKHRAINRGIDEATGELFFIVDSDDFLPEDSLSTIMEYYGNVFERKDIAGVVGRRGYNHSSPIGGESKCDMLVTDTLRLRYKYKLKGDLAEVFKTSVIRKYPFPDIEGEKFAAESLIWNRIAKEHNIFFFNKIIYITEYLENGLSANTILNRKKSPTYAMLLYKELSESGIPLLMKFKAVVNYWRFASYSNKKLREIFKQISLLLSLFALPFAILLYIKDKKNK